MIISDEIQKSKPATLFFLSKYGCLVEKIKFFSKITIETVWDECDIIVTSNPELLVESPGNIQTVKVDSTYNQKYKSDFQIKDISEFEILYKKLKLIKNDFIIG